MSSWSLPSASLTIILAVAQSHPAVSNRLHPCQLQMVTSSRFMVLSLKSYVVPWSNMLCWKMQLGCNWKCSSIRWLKTWCWQKLYRSHSDLQILSPCIEDDWDLTIGIPCSDQSSFRSLGVPVSLVFEQRQVYSSSFPIISTAGRTPRRMRNLRLRSSICFSPSRLVI
jgi:hypothetical protein